MSVDDKEFGDLDSLFTKLAWEESRRFGIDSQGKPGERGCRLLQIVRDLKEELEQTKRERDRWESDCKTAEAKLKTKGES